MIEISTIQDIRQIENKVLGGFTGKQLIVLIIGMILDIIIFLGTKSMFFMMLISIITLALGFFKKGNLNAIEYIRVCLDKNKQPRIRSYKNQNIISEIEKQCISYKANKKSKSKILRIITLTLVLSSVPVFANATTINTDIKGYTEILNMMKIYVRGAGAIVLLIGSADFFINLSNESTDRLVSAMKQIGAGFFLILADSFVQAIANANGTETFMVLLNMVGLIVSFIGAVLAMLGAYKIFSSIKERSAEVKSKGIKLFFSGLMLVAISQSLSSFLM